nr:MAG TPA: hypothetical protein [Caudoviricetes sp.]
MHIIGSTVWATCTARISYTHISADHRGPRFWFTFTSWFPSMSARLA